MNALFDLKGRVAIVTGGAGLLGSVFCKGLAQAGAQVVIVDQNADAVDALAKTTGGLPVVMDITDESAVQALVKVVEEKYSRIDILLNNAATKPKELARFFDPVEAFNMDVWQEVMRVNLDAMFMMAKHVGGYMAKKGSGSIIQTASIYGIMGPDQRIYEGSEYLGHAINTPAIYAASKAGVVGLTQYLATYWGVKNVRVNTLTPGGVESGQNTVFNQKYSQRVPLGRMAKADEMLGAVLFLASDASSYVTGQNIVVDGGLSAW